jgi:hypothetical protein
MDNKAQTNLDIRIQLMMTKKINSIKLDIIIEFGITGDLC